MPNITYYLGAGASANALPTNQKLDESNSLADSFIEVADNLLGIRNQIPGNKHHLYQARHIDLHWLHKEAKRFATVDTYAKYLYTKHDIISLKRLKKTLSFYFTYQQMLNKRFDNRTLTFLTTIMEKGPKFPFNIKIISWNYDFQIQIAANEFIPEIDQINGKHKSLLQYYPYLYYGYENEAIEKYSMVQLNGIAGHIFDINEKLYNPIANKNITEINQLLDWENSAQSKDNLLTFAWENDKKDHNDVIGSYHHENALKIAHSIAAATEILVIIGYSFPFFNREIDNILINAMKKNNKFQKIYFQDKYTSGEFLDKQFGLSGRTPTPVKIEHIAKCDNYFIPPEL